MRQFWKPTDVWANLANTALKPAWYGTDSILTNRQRAFYNRCPHRGSQLIKPSVPIVNTKKIRCPYHGIIFDSHSGEMVKAPRWPDCPQMQLKQLDIRRYGPFAMAHPKTNRSTFNVSDPVPDEQKKLEDLMIPQSRTTIHVKAPPTIVMENFLDTYHVPCIHPELSKSSKIEKHEYVFTDDIGCTFRTTLNTNRQTPFTSFFVPDKKQIAYFTAVWGGKNSGAFAFRMSTHIFAVHLRSDEKGGTIETATLLTNKNKSECEIADMMDWYGEVNNEDVEACEMVAIGRKTGHHTKSEYHPEYEKYSEHYVKNCL